MDSDEDDADAADALPAPAAPDGDQQADRSFLHAMPGEKYLHAIARPAKTSNAKFSDLVDEPFTRDSYLEALQGSTVDQQAAALRDLFDAYATRFDLWRIEAQQGFSLLFHGAGSKRQLLNTFANTTLKRFGHVVIINGFLATLAIVDILSAIEALVSPDSEQSRTSGPAKVRATAVDKLEARASSIGEALSSEEDSKPVYLIVHNIDAAPLRSIKARAVLALLAAQPKIHLIASVDHVRAMLLFPADLVNVRPIAEHEAGNSSGRGFAFLHHHTPTFLPYTQETLLSGTPSTLFAPSVFPPLASLSSSKSSASRIQGVLSILASLNDNAKAIFKTLATKQIELINALPEATQRKLGLEAYSNSSSTTTTSAQGTPIVASSYQSIFTVCRDNFWASSDTQFDALLAEFKDHDVVVASQDGPEGVQVDDGAEEDGEDDHGVSGKGWIWIALSKDAMVSVLERKEREYTCLIRVR